MNSRSASALLVCSLFTAAWVSGACSAPEAEDGDATSEDAISTANVAKKLLDVNDVSILFPSGADGSPRPEITMSETDDQGVELFSEANFQAVKTFAETTSKSGVVLNGDVGARSSWRVVGMRFDPCAPTSKVSATDPTKLATPIPLGGGQAITECIAQMRLIVQPFTKSGGKLQGFDTTAHLVFNIGTPTALGGKDAYLGFLKQMGGLLTQIRDKSATSGGTTIGRTLGVHPGLAKDPAGVGALVTRFIKTTAAFASKGEAAGAATKSIAFMGLEGGFAEPWAFFAGRVVPNGGWAPVPMPKFPTVSPPVQVISFLNAPMDRITPAGASQALFESSKDASTIRTIDDAANTHFFNMDCVSCHTSGSRTQLVSGLSIADALHPAPKGVTGYVRRESSQDSSWNVRNFGYFRGKPTVASRTLTETMDVVLYMNTVVLTNDDDRKQLARTGFVGPARDCTAVDSTVATCFLNGGADDDTTLEGKNGKCTAQCGGFATGLNDDPEPTDPVIPPPITPDPKADKCDSANAAITVSADGRSASLAGDKGKCLAISLGSFRSVPADIVCPESGRCDLSIRNGNFNRIPARRLFNTLRVAPVNGRKVFEAKDGTRSIRIECTDPAAAGVPACTIGITK